MMEDNQSLYFGKHPHPGWDTFGTDQLGRTNVRSIKSYVVVKFLFLLAFLCEVDLPADLGFEPNRPYPLLSRGIVCDIQPHKSH